VHLLRDALPRARRGSAVSSVVVGIGNAFRGDDGVGLRVVEMLRDRVAPDVRVVACEEEPSRLIDAWEGASATVVVDAVVSGGDPGSIYRFDASDAPIPTGEFRSSTHAFSLGETIEIARALGRLPARVVVYGIEGADFTAGNELTEPVAAAIDGVAAAVLDDLGGGR
jgi:hydrogenase maturation protease